MKFFFPILENSTRASAFISRKSKSTGDPRTEALLKTFREYSIASLKNVGSCRKQESICLQLGSAMYNLLEEIFKRDSSVTLSDRNLTTFFKFISDELRRLKRDDMEYVQRKLILKLWQLIEAHPNDGPTEALLSQIDQMDASSRVLNWLKNLDAPFSAWILNAHSSDLPQHDENKRCKH